MADQLPVVTPAPAAGNTVAAPADNQPLLTPQAPAAKQGEVPAAPATASETAPAAAEKPADDAILTPGKTAEKKPAESKPADQAPEAYQPFKLPEGLKLEGDQLGEVATMFKGLNLSQEKAQQLVDYYAKRMVDDKARYLEELAEKQKAWRAEIRARPGFAAERALAQQGMNAVITDPDEQELFTNSWLADHPALFKVFTKIGRLVAEDTIPNGGDSTETQDVNLRRFPQK